jgi:hypothetical protein
MVTQPVVPNTVLNSVMWFLYFRPGIPLLTLVVCVLINNQTVLYEVVLSANKIGAL